MGMVIHSCRVKRNYLRRWTGEAFLPCQEELSLVLEWCSIPATSRGSVSAVGLVKRSCSIKRKCLCCWTGEAFLTDSVARSRRVPCVSYPTALRSVCASV